MKVSEMLDDIEQQVQNFATRTTAPDRFMMLDWMSQELNEITGLAPWDWAVLNLDPIIKTTTGTRNYLLPENFPDNFIRHASWYQTQWSSSADDEFVCKLDDGSIEQVLMWRSPAQYMSQTIRGASNMRPSTYTVMTNAAGRKELWLFPPPDANGTSAYTVKGLYLPTDWKLTEEAQLPPLPANSAILKYAVLRRLDRKTYEPLYLSALQTLMFRAAENRRARVLPLKSPSGLRDRWSLMRP